MCRGLNAVATNGRYVCTEPIPGPLPTILLNDAAGKAYVARANALRELRSHPGWRAGEDQRRIRERRTRLATQRARTDEELEGQQCQIEALRALGDILAEYEAMEGGTGREEVAPPDTISDFTEDEAREAIARGRAVRDMVGLMGWHVFVRDVAALIRAHAWLLTRCPASERRAIQARIAELKTVLVDFQRAVNLGLEAEEWQQAQVEEAVRGKEQDDAR